VMCFRIMLVVTIVPALFGADELQLALAFRAQSDYDRVELASAPQLQDTARCIQSEAAWLPVAPRPELSLAHFRKGYCTLASATITGNSMDFADAAGEFDKAIEAWPDRTPRNSKNTVPEPVSSGVRVLASIARWKAKGEGTAIGPARQEMAAAIQPAACLSNIMPVSLCETVLQTGQQWLGWMALQRDDLYEAAKDLAAAPENAWSHWTAGRQAFKEGSTRMRRGSIARR